MERNYLTELKRGVEGAVRGFTNQKTADGTKTIIKGHPVGHAEKQRGTPCFIKRKTVFSLQNRMEEGIVRFLFPPRWD